MAAAGYRKTMIRKIAQPGAFGDMECSSEGNW